MRDIVVMAHNIRSTHNVGALFRTCEGFGVTSLILSGYTAYPHIPEDSRLPHIASKLTAQIEKTALGATKTQHFRYQPSPPIAELRNKGYRIVGLEQHNRSIQLPNYSAPDKIALLLGEEVSGIDAKLLRACDDLVEIPMYGTKESFNVSVAAGIALYGLFHLP